MNIKFCYLYRDSGNYKNFNEVIFSNLNEISVYYIEACINKSLIDGKWFVAKEWNLPDLHFVEFAYDADIDHDWHEFEMVEETKEDASEENSIQVFLSLVNKTKLPW